MARTVDLSAGPHYACGMIDYPENWKNLKVGLCHDWLTGMRGGERVLEILGDGFPDARIYTLIHNRKAMSERINKHPITTSWMQSLPHIFNKYRYLLPLFPAALNSLHHDPADLIISSSHCVAKGLKTREETKHLSYCFTPMRYAWLFHDEYFGKNKFKRAAINPILAEMRHWDKKSSNRVDRFVAISQHVRKRIEQFYGRDADVVYPPTDTDFFTPGDAPAEEFDFIISAMVPYKKVDLAVKVYSQSGFPLKVMGSGSGLDGLKAIAGPNIEFLGRQPDEILREHYQRCRFVIFPGEEDYGIVPVEAMACGKPVIAYAKGGATETVVNGETGIYFDTQSEAGLIDAIKQAESNSWDPTTIRKRAELFNIQQFVDGMDASIQQCRSND